MINSLLITIPILLFIILSMILFIKDLEGVEQKKREVKILIFINIYLLLLFTIFANFLLVIYFSITLIIVILLYKFHFLS